MSSSEEDQVQQRRQNLEAITRLGYAAYPNKFDTTHTVSELVSAHGNTEGPALDANRVQTVTAGRTVGILSKSDFLKKVDRKLILVDHNELSQAVAGADQVEITEIIDHHRIGALTTQQPILFRNEPVGSTSTIVADCFFRYRVELPPSIAGIWSTV